MSKSPFDIVVCVGCKTPYLTALEEPLKSFCPHCRGEYGIRDDKDAEDVLQMIDLGICTQEPKGWWGKRSHPHKDGKTGRFLPAVKADPVIVAEGLRAMTDHRVAPVAQFEKPITYVTCKNGLFEVRHSDLATIYKKATDVLGILEEGKEGMVLNIPKLPLDILKKVVVFFRGVCERQKGSSEALVQVWWDLQEKVHTMHVPEQDV